VTAGCGLPVVDITQFRRLRFRMRPLKLIALLASLFSASTASAQDAYRDMKLDTAMEIHAGITAGWLIAKNCKLLEPAELAALEKNRGIIKASLGWNAAYFPAEEETAAEIAREKPYSDCGPDARQAVSEAVRFAREWAAEIAAGSPKG
jgi:hypothetical protein